MTLDKAIEVYEFWANAHERDAKYHRPLGYAHESIANVAEMQAREERQIAEWLKELKAYRETYPYGVEGYPPRAEPSDSEKPNNCKDLQDWKDRMWAEAIVTEPTISKMEQVEDEPMTDCGDFANRLAYERGVKHAWEVAQKVFDSTVTFYEAEDVAKQIDKDINVRSKDEPQTQTEIAKVIVHKMIDDAVIAEDVYPDLRQKMHDAVDEYEPQTDCAWRKGE